MNSVVKKVLLIALAVLIVMQFIPMDTSAPAVVPQRDFINVTNPPQDVAKMLKAACYDCHSHETVYPWYSRIQPVGWWLLGHVNNGKDELNFSEWTNYSSEKQAHKLAESIELIEERHMPLKSYTWTHPDAVLSDEDIATLNKWLDSVN